MCSGIGLNTFNPFHYRLNCKTGTAATLFTVLALITLIAGSSPLLGVNTLGQFNPWVCGSLVLSGSGGLLFAGAWWLSQLKETKEVEKPIPHQEKAPASRPIDLKDEKVVLPNERGPLITFIHSIDSIERLNELLEKSKPDEFFLHILIRCRIARLDLERKGQKIFDLERDLVIPVCNEGKNRSPALYSTLRLLYPELNVLSPHGALGGFDPGSDPMWAAMASYHEEISSPDIAFCDQGFQLAYRESRPHRQGLEAAKELKLPLGEEEWQYYQGIKAAICAGERPSKQDYRVANFDENAKKIDRLKEWMDQNLFRLAEKQPGKRVIFIPLVARAHRRIVERVAETGHLARVTQERDYNDPFVAPKTTTAYAQAAELFTTQFLDDLTAGKIFPFDN